VTSRFDTAEAFAYVDNCLPPADRRAFEARLREDPDLRRQVAIWEAQNGAIRAAYGAMPSSRATIDLGRNSNENVPAWIGSAVPSRRKGAETFAASEARSWLARPETATGPAKLAIVPPAKSGLGRGIVAFLALAAGLVVVGAPGSPTWPRDQLLDAGLAAYRAFAAAPAGVPVEYQTDDSEALSRWFAPQLGRGIVVPSFSSNALKLLGGRVAPGTRSSAAFLVYEDRRGERLGLLIEPLDAPGPSTPVLREAGAINIAAWTDARQGLVATGANLDEVAALARLVEDAPAPHR
jgi:anti-sigma factor RsiW